MQTLKDMVIEFLQKQSDNVQADEIIEFVILNQKLREGEDDLQKGKVYTHEQAKEILKKWAH